MSRNERAEKFSKHFRLRGDTYKDLLPRLGLALIFVVTALFLFPPSKRTQEVMFKAGEIADRNVIAPFNFEVPLSDEELKMERATAALAVRPVYVRDVSLETDLVHNLAALFDSLTSLNANDTISTQRKLDIEGSLLPYLSTNLLRHIGDKSRLEPIRDASLAFQKEVLTRGFIDNSGPLRRGAYTEVSVVEGQNEKRVSAKDLVDQGGVDDVIREQGYKVFRKSRSSAQVFFEIVRTHLLPNLMLDSKETDRRREQAMSQVQKTFRVSKNQRIIGKHDKVTAEQEKILIALERTRADMESQESPLTLASLYFGKIVRLLLFVLLFGGYLLVFHRRTYEAFTKLTAILAVMLIYLAFTAVVIRFSLNHYLIPVAFVSLMITALFGYRLGLIATVFSCFLVPLVTNVPEYVGFVSLLAGTMAVFGLLRMRSRSHFYSVFWTVSLAYVVGVTSAELGHVEGITELGKPLGWAIVNALFCSLATMFLLPIFENIFNLTTRFTLLELTDLNKPILKRLNMEAPGTYHHSMLLGSLVDAVAADVGADPLKARVMAYYHDIGKIFKPEYYAENQEAGFNKHEKITPQMSSLILLSHVKDGVELAREEKLPDLIIDAIQQHHGTTVMAFFYQKALETDSHSSVNREDFRYPGPRPRTKEAAALMLADTVEPACRSLQDPTPAHIRNMVVKLINTRAQEGELDFSGLTLNDLARIREKFVSILTGIYHKRVAYPGQERKEEEKQGEAIVKPV